MYCLPSLRRGEWIETEIARNQRYANGVSPRFGGGSGLKHNRCADGWMKVLVSPRFGGGSGLKRCRPFAPKLQFRGLPSLRRGEWIETMSTTVSWSPLN